LNVFHHVAHAPSAITASAARTVPPGVSAIAGFAKPNRETAVCS
jgi:hypothetical protein